MLASGNGDRQQCAANLVKTVRGEVPYDRMKGINRELIDSPTTDKNRVKADVSWLISTYEKRIQSATVTLMARSAAEGHFGIQLAIE